ncbi:MAG TPA: polyprenyl synthetase family protein [Polyangiaceae bacterium]
MAASPVTAENPESALFVRLGRYRELVVPTLMAALPEKEPRRYLYDLVREFVARPGKGLRPALCIATCAAFGGREEHAVPTAAALELLHNGLLVHDDVEDESAYRRSEPTLHTRHGIPIAVNTGDAMNALTLRLLMKNLDVVGARKTWRILEEFDHLLLESLEGQALELGWIRDNDCDVKEEDYLRMVLKKTCWYSFIHPVRLGALIAGDPDLERFDRFGYLTGVAFQIKDDLLNLLGDARYGKEIDGDLWEGKRTLMLTHAFGAASAADRSRLEAILQKSRARRLERDVAWMRRLLDETGSIAFATSAAEELARAAKAEFEQAYSGAPESDEKTLLRELVAYVVDRKL